MNQRILNTLMARSLRAIGMVFVILFSVSSTAIAAYSPTMSWPYDIALEDVNNDGNLDAVIVNRMSDSLQVQLGDGQGKFGAARFFQVGSSPRALAMGDLNADGNIDVITANKFSNDLSVLHGDGTGGFTLIETRSFGAFANGPSSIQLGDMNSDGVLDVVVGHVTSSHLSIILGLSTGRLGFATHLSFPKAVANVSGIRSVALGDINNDTKLDIVIANKFSDNIVMLLGDGVGGVVVSKSTTVGLTPKSVGLADLDKDGNLDIVVANSGSNNTTFIYGTGSGNFDFPGVQAISAGVSPIDGAFVDLNNDGLLDGIIVNELSDNATVIYSDGTTQNVPVGFEPTAVAIGDLNGDGVRDFVVTNGLGNDLTIGITSILPINPPASTPAITQKKSASSSGGGGGCITFVSHEQVGMYLLLGFMFIYLSFGRKQRNLKSEKADDTLL